MNLLLPGDTNYCYDVYRRDLITGTVELVSPSPGGVGSCRPGWGTIVSDVSDDGRYVVFTSDTSDFVPNDTNATFDTFVRDVTLGVTRRASVATGGIQGNGESPWSNASVSNDGQRVLFASRATNLAPGATTPVLKLYMHDFTSNTTTLVSTSYDGTGESTPSYASPIGWLARMGRARCTALRPRTCSLKSTTTMVIDGLLPRVSVAGTADRRRRIERITAEF
jgi:hypothetical protein